MTARAALSFAPDARMQRALVTPEGVPLGLTVASAGSRIAAFSLDVLIIVATLIGMTLLLMLAFWAVGFSRSTAEFIGVLWLFGFFFLRNAYFLMFELGTRAATPGKRIARIRVGARDGGRLTADAIIARNLLREVEVILPLAFLAQTLADDGGAGWTAWAGLGWTALLLLFPLVNRDRLRAGDLIAGTWVIRDPRRPLGSALSGGMRDMKGQADPPAYRFSDADVEAYGVHELHTLEEVLRRNDPAVIATVAQAIGAKIEWSVRHEDSRTFLTAYYAALRGRLERHLLLGRRRRDKHDR